MKPKEDRELIWRIFEAVEASDLRLAVRWFLVILTRHADRDGYGYTGQDTLARQLGCSKREVIRMFSETDQLGWTHRKRRAGPSGRSSDGYFVHIPQGDNGDPTQGDGLSRDNRAPCQLVTSKVPAGHIQGDELSQDLPSDLPRELPRGSAHADASAPTAPLTLSVQGPKPRGRGNGRPKGQRASSKVQAEDDRPESPHRLLRAHYDTEHERLRGAGPVFPRTKESRVGKAWKEILEVVDLDTARAVVTRALTDGYHVEPWQIADNVNRYRGPAPAKPNGQRPRAHQPNAPEVPDYLRPKEPAP